MCFEELDCVLRFMHHGFKQRAINLKKCRMWVSQPQRFTFLNESKDQEQKLFHWFGSFYKNFDLLSNNALAIMVINSNSTFLICENYGAIT